MLYDGDELVAEYSAPATGSPVLLRRYVHGAGSDDPLIWYEGAGIASTALRRLRSNHQGSIVAVTDNVGTALTINAYDEWGIPAATNQGRFQYTGQAWIPELGLYYYKARIYSPTLGRFMQTDPIGYEGGMNLYDYVGGDPVNSRDPSGLYKCKGNAEQCGQFKDGLRQLRNAAEKSIKTGTRIKDNALSKAVRFYGREGKSGPDITFDKEDAGTLGSFDKGNNSVNFDLKQITNSQSQSGTFSSIFIGGVIAHEGAHGSRNRHINNPKQRFYEEIYAYASQSQFFASSGVNDRISGTFTISGGVNTTRIRDGALGSCNASTIGTNQSASECAYASATSGY